MLKPQPIDTAPKDGTKIVGIELTHNGGLRCSVVWWGDTSHIYHPMWGKFKQAEWWRHNGGGNEWYDPDYWLPLDAITPEGTTP